MMITPIKSVGAVEISVSLNLSNLSITNRTLSLLWDREAGSTNGAEVSQPLIPNNYYFSIQLSTSSHRNYDRSPEFSREET